MLSERVMTLDALPVTSCFYGWDGDGVNEITSYSKLTARLMTSGLWLFLPGRSKPI
jgi:hypothetical protein